MSDQAEALRHLVRSRDQQPSATRVVTVTSGKGGVGKSNFTLNFALALQDLGQKVLIFDADLGMANIDVLMGIAAPRNLYHLIKGQHSIWDIMQKGTAGIHFIAGGSGFKDLLELTLAELEIVERQLAQLHGIYDIILFDTGAGLTKETVRFITAAEETLIVTTPEPTSITDAYALIKMVKAMDHNVDFKLIVNRAADLKEGEMTASKISQVAERFLEKTVPALGIVREDAFVPKAVKRQIPFTQAYPGSLAAGDIRLIARKFCSAAAHSGQAENSGIRSFIQKIFSRIK